MTQDDLAWMEEFDCVIVTEEHNGVMVGEIGAVVLLLQLSPDSPSSALMVEFSNGRVVNLEP